MAWVRQVVPGVLEGQRWPALLEHGVPPWGPGRPRQENVRPRGLDLILLAVREAWMVLDTDQSDVVMALAFVSSVGGMLPRISQRPVTSHKPWGRQGAGRERKREMALVD